MTLTVDWERMSLCRLNTFSLRVRRVTWALVMEESSVGILREQHMSV